MHYFPGNFGHLAVIISFITSLMAFGIYMHATNINDRRWQKFANIFYYIHTVAVFTVAGTLFYIIYSHYFEYHYAWSHTSELLPFYYQISSFWEGQEGSFLLWIFWNAILGLVIIRTNRKWTSSVMTVFCLIQAFLTSMILGVVPFETLKIGSSPFMLLRDVVKAPMFKINPDFIPKDGNGLNPLLQNYWMVIHPPTLFLGFATTMVPFAYCIAGLWKKNVKEWIRPALPWAQFSALVLGIGILMGAYWAYETLNFGGYWNWDPVENAIFVPWLIMVGAIHTMIAYKKSEKALKASVILVVTSFLLIVYSTYLTRSGVLGDSSVHSFTDLGLNNQLLTYLLTFVAGSVLLMIIRWKLIPSTKEELETYSREFWIFLGVTTLCLMAFHVIFVTSYPVFNRLGDLVGADLDLAPPVDQVGDYTKIQIWFAILLAALSGTGQFFWWKKMDLKSLRKVLTVPVIVSLAITVIVAFTGYLSTFDQEDKTNGEVVFSFFKYFLLFFFCVYSIVANITVLLSVLKTSPKLSGGAITHIGVAMMLMGILFSSGYDQIVSKNYTGMLWSNEFPEEVNKNNLLIYQNDPREMDRYTLNYKGIRRLFKDKGYVNQNFVRETGDPEIYIASKDIPEKDITKGDSLAIEGVENSYFEIEYTAKNGNQFTLFPRVQMNEAMGVVYSPDIKRNPLADLYTHVRTFPDPNVRQDWGDTEQIKVKIGETFYLNDYVAVLESVSRVDEVDGVVLNTNDAAVKAVVKIEGETDTYYAEPLFIIKDRTVGKIEEIVHDLAIKIKLDEIKPEEGSFTFAVNTAQKDWIILEAVEKPLINILWLGTLILTIGFIVAIRRRYVEFVKMREKQME
ncbi:MAG: cytochrome c biogenesis protein CcsA [Cyclobacteriaceae bacterium]